MTEKLLNKLSIIIENTNFPPQFLSCTGDQWQAFTQLLSSSSSSQTLQIDWWHYASSNISIANIIRVSPDLILYCALPILLIQFGLLYSFRTSQALLVASSKLSHIFVCFAFGVLCYQVTFLSFSNTYSMAFLGGLYKVDFFTVLSKFFMLMIWLALNKFVNTLSNGGQGVSEFPILSHLVLCFSFTMLSSGDLALFVISLEGFSLILYIMASIGRLHGGIVAAVKYFSFGTAGSILILWGTVHYYELTSSLSFKAISFLVLSSEELLLSAELANKIEWASILILVGLLVKLGAAPTHQWIPDVYAGVSMFVTSFYSIFVKFVLFTLFLRLSSQLASSSEIEFIAASSLIVGCFGALRQVELKRFLAYGSITHVGFLLAGDFSSSMIYLASYMLASLALFSVLLSLKVNGSELVYLSDLRLVASSGNQWDRLIIVLSLASMAGLPPFAGFYGKMLIWSSLIEDIYLFNDTSSYLLLVLNLLASLVVIFYYMRLIVLVYLGAETSVDIVMPYQLIESRPFGAAYSSILNVKVLQSISMLLLVFWTVVMPLGLSLSVSCSECLA